MNHGAAPYIWIIEDDETLRDCYQETLSEYFSVKTFPSAKDAYQNLTHLNSDEKPPHLILCDYFLGEMSGMDFLKRLDDYESPMPVIFMTGDREQIPYKENQNRNLFGILEKPFTIESVAEILQQTLDKIYNFSTK